MALVDLNLWCIHSATKQVNVHDGFIPGKKDYFIIFILLLVYCLFTYKIKEKHYNFHSPGNINILNG